MAQEEKSDVSSLQFLRTQPEKLEEMIATAKKIATPGKGILAADESTGTIGKRFAGIKLGDNPSEEEKKNVENNEVNRRRYRELLFKTPDIGKWISGVIMFEETLYQRLGDDSQSFVEYLNDKEVIVGIKVDKGTYDLPFKPGGKFTQGLTGLDSKPGAKGRAQTYYEAGARFAKWRAVLEIRNGYVSQASIDETAWTLARYAAICQKNGLVPIVEPELLMDGDHSLEVCQYWTEKIVTACYKALSDQEVVLEATLLKPNMCLPGVDYKGVRSLQANAKATVDMLRRSVPAAVPGITFLSGGQGEEDASQILNEINRWNQKKVPKNNDLYKGREQEAYVFPWEPTFSYGRALQASTLQVWQGKDENIEAAQKQFAARAGANSDAQLGEYDGQAACVVVNSLYEKGYTY